MQEVDMIVYVQTRTKETNVSHHSNAKGWLLVVDSIVLSHAVSIWQPIRPIKLSESLTMHERMGS